MSEDKTKAGNFVEIEDEEIPDIVNWDETPQVVGKIKSFKTIKVDRKNVECCIMEDGDKRFGVWVSTGLDVLHTLKTGTVVQITSVGLEQKRNSSQFWRRFKVAFDPSTGGYKPKKED